jgi:AraC family transcriptional regulator
MPDLAPICRALDLVETHLTGPIGVADMADAAGYSLYHFSRTFNAATHHTPYDYLMRRRLTEAARAVVSTDDRILDIALAYQFNNPETFSRAFKRVLGLQPSEARRQGTIDSRQLMPRLTPAHLAQLARGPYLRPILGAAIALRLVGLLAPVGNGREGVARLWARLRREVGDAAGERVGAAYYPLGWARHGPLYLAGIRAPDGAPDGFAPGALAAKTLSFDAHARFVHKGRPGDLGLSLDYVYHTWLPKSGYRLAGPWIVETYGAAWPDDDDDDLEIGLLVPIEA